MSFISSPPSNSLTTECGHSFCQDWSPPASLLEALSGDDDLIVDLIHIFSTDVDARLERMREALAAANFQTIRAEAHTIKGSAGQLGAGAVAEVCQGIEIVSDLEAPLLIPARLKRVRELFEEIRVAMASYAIGRKPGFSAKPGI
jgi:HPt (histidine-containing phosphotransfer) domain-containing protein